MARASMSSFPAIGGCCRIRVSSRIRALGTSARWTATGSSALRFDATTYVVCAMIRSISLSRSCALEGMLNEGLRAESPQKPL